jgi:hypothetical protein
LLKRGNRRVVKEMLTFKDSKGVASAKKELFLGRRITMQGLVYSHVLRNKRKRL